MSVRLNPQTSNTVLNKTKKKIKNKNTYLQLRGLRIEFSNKCQENKMQ